MVLKYTFKTLLLYLIVDIIFLFEYDKSCNLGTGNVANICSIIFGIEDICAKVLGRIRHKLSYLKQD